MPRPLLPPRARTALILVSCGFSLTECAGLMGISRSGVKSALHTARNKLGANNDAHCVARAFAGGYLDPQDLDGTLG